MTAVITGCTDGIGRAYLEELVTTRGIRKLYLIGRNPNKVEKLAKHFGAFLILLFKMLDLLQSMNSAVRCAQPSLTLSEIHWINCRPSWRICQLAFWVSPLFSENPYARNAVNCAGIAPEQVANMVELPAGMPSKILRVNLLSCVRMIEMVLPGMVRRNQGIVVNIASITVEMQLHVDAK